MGGSAKNFAGPRPTTGRSAVARPGDPATPGTVATLMSQSVARWRTPGTRVGTAVPRGEGGPSMPPSVGAAAAKGVAAGKAAADRTRASLGRSY